MEVGRIRKEAFQVFSPDHICIESALVCGEPESAELTIKMRAQESLPEAGTETPS